MQPAPHDHRLEIAELRRRIEELEKRVGIAAAAQHAAPPNVAPLPSAPPTAAPLSLHAEAPAATPVKPETPAALPPPLPQAAVTLAAAPPSTPPTTPPTAPPTHPPIASTPRHPSFTAAPARTPAQQPAPAAGPNAMGRLEQLVGGRWYAVVGAIIVVMGVALGIKLAYDKGLLTIAPWARYMLAAAFGLGLLGVGEVVRKRIGALAAAGILSAGVGTIFASAYAAYALHKLLPPPVAFLLMACAAGLGIAVAVRSGLVSVALLSLVCGYLTPILLSEGEAHPAVLPAYLLALLAVGLVLSVWKSGRFTLLRSAVWWGTFVLGFLWLAATDARHTLIACAFAGLFWAAVHAELVWSATHRGLQGAGTGALDMSKGRSWWGSARPILVSFGTTGWCAFIGAVVLHKLTPDLDYLATGALACAAVGIALPMAGHLRGFVDRPETQAEQLGAGLWVQALMLAAATCSLAFTTTGEITAWILLSVAATAAGFWLRSKALLLYAAAAGAVGSVRLLVFDSWVGGVTGTTLADFGTVRFTLWSLFCVFAAVAWGGLGACCRALFRDLNAWRGFAHTAMSAGIGMLAAAWLLHASHDAAVVVFAVAAALAATLAALLGSRVIVVCAGLFAAASTIALLSTFWWETEPVWSLLAWKGGPGNALALAPFAACLAGAAACRFGRRRLAIPAVLFSCGALAVLCAAAVHTEAQPQTIALWWLFIATALVAAQTARPTLRTAVYGIGVAMGALLLTFAGYVEGGFARSGELLTLHHGLWISLLIAGLFSVVLARCSSGWPAAIRNILAVVVLFLLLAPVSVEVARQTKRAFGDGAAAMAAVSLWWGIFSFGLIAAGFRSGIAPLRHAGLILLGVATLKAVVFDLRDVSAAGRVASFIGLGLLNLAVNVVYQKVASRKAAPPEPALPVPAAPTAAEQQPPPA